MNNNHAKLISGDVGKTLRNLTIPMIFGMISLVIFNLVDTFFVGQLGTEPLAAISFTFPIVFIIGSITVGLGTGAAAVISRAIGEGNHHNVERTTTDSLILGMIFVAFFGFLGFLTIEPLFKLLGATPTVLPMIKTYMSIWYSGVLFLVIPMIGNSAIRAAGNTKIPSMIMVISIGTNTIPDPIMIFGLGPIPRMEIAGAAMATVIARAVALMLSLYFLGYRERMLTLNIFPIKSIIESWKRILYIGIPNGVTRLVIPLAIAVITRIVSSYGVEAVAGYGVAIRVEFFAFVVLMALSTVLIPFVGQNWGAKEYGRVKESIKISHLFSLKWGVGTFIFFAILAYPIAVIFNKDPIVISTIMLYLRVIPLSYGFFGVVVLTSAALNALHKPMHAFTLTAIQMFVLYIPLAFLGSYLFGLAGVFSAIAITHFLSAIMAHFILKRSLLGV